MMLQLGLRDCGSECCHCEAGMSDTRRGCFPNTEDGISVDDVDRPELDDYSRVQMSETDVASLAESRMPVRY